MFSPDEYPSARSRRPHRWGAAGPITNHVNFIRSANRSFAYTTIGSLNKVLAFCTDNFLQVASIAVGNLPHGIWPSADGMRVYVGPENGDALVVIDTLTNKIAAAVPIAQAPYP